MNQDFLDIPELVHHLSPYLSPADLLTCVQLNSTWNKAFIPFLWQSIDDSAQSWGNILCQITNPHPQPPPPAAINAATEVTTTTAPESSPFGVPFFDIHKSLVRDSDLTKDRDWLFTIFEKYGHHIRELKISHPLVLEAASRKETCTSLYTLVLDLNQNTTEPRLEHLPFSHAPSQPPPLPAVPGFGVMVSAPPLQVPDPYQESDIELSEPLFPGHLKLVDFKITMPYGNVTPESKMASMEHIWTLDQHTWHLIRVNPGLMRLHTSKYQREGSRISADFVCATLRLLKHLKDLDGNDRLFGHVEFWKLWDALPDEIGSLSFQSFSSPAVFPLPEPLPEAYASLKVLRAGGVTTVNGLLTLLGIFPNLTQLRLGKVEENPIYTSSSNYTPLPPVPFGGQSLRKLEGTVQDWDTVFRYISSIVVWETGSEYLCDDVALFLKDRCLNLETFRTTIQPWFIDERGLAGIRGNDPTNQFLITHRHLREFDSIENFIKVDEMLREPWTCMGLEWLTCRIVGLDRLTTIEEETAARIMAPGYSVELSEEETRVVEKFNRCRAQHHGVYDRLASLTRLKHLDLGYENRYPWTYKAGEVYVGEDGEEYLHYDPPTFDTLELTLESGLGRLGALKNLEMFGFECLNHKIGKTELDWMAKSWPKLNLMYGLDSERLYQFEHDEDRAALREYFTKLRPDVVHDSLFEDDV
ncbi:MAG: hypothetical protein JOS17DRAFT_796834 [Linnemannia elongata]|nr:MAG: hypothetical protein JOS17DRAFT_796834 [Linnemannia elongata]